VDPKSREETGSSFFYQPVRAHYQVLEERSGKNIKKSDKKFQKKNSKQK
jgi:hypothetical protein